MSSEEQKGPEEQRTTELAPSVLTPVRVVLLAVMAAFVTVVNAVTSAFTPTWMQSGRLLGWGQLSAGTILFALLTPFFLASPSLRKKVSIQMLTVLWATYATTVSLCGEGYLQWSNLSCMMTAVTYRPVQGRFISWIYGTQVPFEIAAKQLIGGNPVPWEYYALPVAAMSLVSIVWFVYWSMLHSINRRQWLDVERLPYPYTYVPRILIANMTEPEKRRPEIRLFLLFFVIGILFFLPVALRNIFVWMPDLYGFSKPPFISWKIGAIDITQTPLREVIVGLQAVSIDPSDFAIAFLLPNFILFPAFITQVILQVLYQVAYYMGYYPGITATAGYEARRRMLELLPPFKIISVADYGMAPALIVAWLFFGRKYVASVLRAAIKGPTADETVREAFSYRTQVITLAGCAILIIGLYNWFGQSFVGSLITLLMMTLIIMSATRSVGFGGRTSTDWNMWAGWQTWRYVGVTQETMTREYVNDVFLMNRPLLYITGSHTGTDVMFMYRLAQATNTRPRDVLIPMIIAIVIGVPLGFYTLMTIRWAFGAKLPHPLTWEGGWVNSTGDPLYIRAWPAPDPVDWIPWAAAGWIIAFVLTYLSRAFVWWPFHPFGVYTGIISYNFIMIPYAVAWTVKRIAYRIGGERFFESRIVPCAIGYIAGQWLTTFFTGLAGVIRYFYPF